MDSSAHLSSTHQACRLCGAQLHGPFAFCSRCGAAVDVEIANDFVADELRTLFGGDLLIQHAIGRGAMGIVYAGFDPALKRRVAIKVLAPDLADDPAMVRRFQREAQTVASLQHPNVVAVYGLRSNDRLSTIIMQHVDGRSLDAVLRESRLPLQVAGVVLSQTAAALHHAHGHGVVHRDVKPGNVLLDGMGRAIVSDFGIASRDGLSRSTASGLILGTAAYLSPEQCLARRADQASDQYSFGVMAFELLAGRLPFQGTVERLLWAHLNEAPPSLAELRPDLSAGVVGYVMRALEKDPAKRHASLRDAERVFRTLVDDELSATTELMRISFPRAGRPPSAVAPIAPPATIRVERAATPRAALRRSWIWISVALIGAILGAAIVGMLRARPR